MRTLTFVALVALAILAIATQARASSPCAAPCMGQVPIPVYQSHVYQPHEVPPIYVVNQGPVYAGDGIWARPQVVVPRRLPDYPYVASDYPYYYGEPLPGRSHRRSAIRARY